MLGRVVLRTEHWHAFPERKRSREPHGEKETQTTQMTRWPLQMEEIEKLEGVQITSGRRGRWLGLQWEANHGKVFFFFF
jgi:hypothetical protein